ncbi:hypothetical protein RBB50_005304 [Rhinocladiella similis]
MLKLHLRSYNLHPKLFDFQIARLFDTQAFLSSTQRPSLFSPIHHLSPQVTRAQAILPARRPYQTTPPTMSDDASYTSFLERANASPQSHPSTHEQASSTSERRTQFDPSTSSSTSAALPESLQSLPSDITYTSETDSPFEPVVFNYADTSLPSATQFEKCLHHKIRHNDASGGVEELTTSEFDPRGEYKDIIARVEQASNNGAGVKVFRVQFSETRVAYYIVTVGERMLVGVVTKAIES